MYMLKPIILNIQRILLKRVTCVIETCAIQTIYYPNICLADTYFFTVYNFVCFYPMALYASPVHAVVCMSCDFMKLSHSLILPLWLVSVFLLVSFY